MRGEAKWHYILEQKEAADTVRKLVEEGGTVIMTGYSAYVDETGKEYLEELELHTAVSAGERKANQECVISSNDYGKGKAYYVALEADAEVLGALIEMIAQETGLAKPLYTPDGVRGRKIAPHQYFYVNTLDTPVCVPLEEDGCGVLSGQEYTKELQLKPYDSELIVKK